MEVSTAVQTNVGVPETFLLVCRAGQAGDAVLFGKYRRRAVGAQAVVPIRHRYMPVERTVIIALGWSPAGLFCVNRVVNA